VSVRSTVVGGRVASVTPSFLGANPATVPGGPLAGHRALDGEETLARAVLAALSAEERSVAVVDPVAPPEIMSGTGRRADLRRPPQGISRSQLGETARGALDRLIRHYLDRSPDAVADAAWERLTGAGLDAVSFAWAGSDRPGQGHDPANDWGDDVLAEHYRTAHAP
jgi:hypothetical protein